MRDSGFLLSLLPWCSWSRSHPSTGVPCVLLDPSTVMSQAGTSPALCCPLHASSCHSRAVLIPPDSAFLLSFSAGEWHTPALSLLIPCSWHIHPPQPQCLSPSAVQV